jgi:hypothetical protein
LSEPLKAGDLAEVINGLGRGKSPNLGKIVTVGKLAGESYHYGPIRHCTGPGVIQLSDNGDYIVTNEADFPVAWLRKIEPPKVGTHKARQRGVTA